MTRRPERSRNQNDSQELENQKVETASLSRRNESNSSDEPRKVIPKRKRSLQRLSNVLLHKPEAPRKATREIPSTPAQKPPPSEENKEQN
ncbi:hypothetical protein NIES4071_21690 [Calothrix sp. NIES-4071]|nr:hypothetical protein NIES4071_21690 [Calothrix sp. NIES-4071]BAZ56501.1 hypothetical protein NIES4105_21640 [Calothrix sp. NIES-4105]